MKTCSRCRTNKRLNEFQTDKRYSLGVAGWCKPCRAEYGRGWGARNSARPRPVVADKKCPTCGITKPGSEFSRCSSKRDGLASRCKACRIELEKIPRMTTDRSFRAGLKRRYGMSPEDLQQLLETQQNRCAICSDELTRPFIDHNHSTGHVRGVVCCRCNSWLAAIEHSAFMAKAAAYLDHHRTASPKFRINPRYQELQRLKAQRRKHLRSA